MTTRQLTDLPYDQKHLVHQVSGRLVALFAGVFGPETIERFVIDSMDQLVPSAKTTAFLPLLTERFARERLQALAKVEGTLPSVVPGVLFLCVHNAGRSQMAAGWMRRLAVIVSSSTQEAPSLPRRSTVPSSRPWTRSGSTSGQSSQSRGPTKSFAPSMS